MDPIAEQLIARLQGDPHDSAAFEALQAHYRHAGDLASLANLLEGWADGHARDVESGSQAYLEAADAVLQSGGDRARAKRLYRHAAQLWVLNRDASERLQALLEGGSEYQELADFLDGYARALEAAAPGDPQLVTLYQRLAQLWQDYFNRPDVAVAYQERAAELSGGGAAAPAEAPAEPFQDPRALAEEFEAALAQENDPAGRAELLSQLAEVRQHQLGDIGGAIAALRQALASVPGDVAVMHQLAGCLLARAETAEPEAARADHRRVAELFYQIAQAVDDTQAITYLESALASMPDHDGALALLERLARAQGQEQLLAQYWVGYVASAGESPELDQRRLALGQAYLAAGQLDDAIYCLQPVAEHGSDRAHELLQEAYGKQARAPHAQAQAATLAGGFAAAPSLLPTTRPAASAPAELEPEGKESAELIALRKQVHEAIATRKHDQAAELCRALLELEPSDAEAFNLLESHYRKRRDFPGLRDLLMGSTRIAGLSVDVRKQRLREVATLSETKLRDSDAAISAFRGVVTLDPGDREAGASLKRLLKKAQQWDELAAVLEREALATTSVDDKAALIREIALIHRDKRKDPAETAAAFRQLHALKPDDGAVRDELCELLTALEDWPETVPLLRARIAASRDEIDKLKLSNQLVAILHEKLHDHAAAYDLCEQILLLRPNDRATLDRMERVDEAAHNFPRLLETLARRVALAGKVERPALLIRMGGIAEQELRDLDRAADYYGDALDLAPDNQGALERLSQMFESAGRYDQLVELLRERSLLEKEPKNRAPLLRRIAETLTTRLDDQAGAADAYRRLLELGEDESALRFLLGHARDGGADAAELADVLRRVAALSQDEAERRELLFEQAQVLHERLSRPAEAAVALKRLVDEIDPAFLPAIELLAQVSEVNGDLPGLALALERRLPLLTERDERLSLARRLSDLCERELRDDARAITALQQWSRDDTGDPEPLRRLRPLLERAERWTELLQTLDLLAENELDFDQRDESTIAAARVAHARLGDGQGAFGRLIAQVEQRNETAERALREIALAAGMQRELSALYVKLARETEDPAAQAQYWGSAAELFETALGAPEQAFEASLRMLATDLGNRAYLAQVDRLGRATAAFKRLAQVYDRLLKQAEDDADKVALLRRHADLLEAAQPDEALDRILRACALSPHDEELLARAEHLADRTRRSEELLVVYDRRRARSEDDRDKLRLLLRAARLCDGALRDRARAHHYLKQALAVTGDSAELGLEVEAMAAALDAERPDLGPDEVRRTLVRSHREVAERAEPGTAARLWLRGAELLAQQLDDERGAFDVLRQAIGQLPRNDRVYAALLESGARLKRMDAIDAHLARLVDDAIDPNTALALLQRRGELLEGPLGRPQDAAAVYTKILQLRPDDAGAAEKLRACLRNAGRFQELLLALNKQLQRTREPARRVRLLKEIAISWERDLKNRWEATDAWKAVLRESPDDADALAGLQRIERARTLSGDDAAPTSDAPPPELPPEPALAAAPEPAAPEPESAAEAPMQAEAASDAATAAAAGDEEGSAAKSNGEKKRGKKRRGKKRDEAAAEPESASASAPPAAVEAAVAVAPPETTPELAALAAITAEVARDRAVAFMPPAPPPSPPPSTPAPRPFIVTAPVIEPDPSEELAALDADLDAGGRHREEIDVLEDLDGVAVDVEVAPPAPVRRSSMPPPIPGRASRPNPPPQPGRASSEPPPPPPPRRSGPPPVPVSARSSNPPPLPSTRPRPTTPPPLPFPRKD